MDIRRWWSILLWILGFFTPPVLFVVGLIEWRLNPTYPFKCMESPLTILLYLIICSSGILLSRRRAMAKIGFIFATFIGLVLETMALHWIGVMLRGGT